MACPCHTLPSSAGGGVILQAAEPPCSSVNSGIPCVMWHLPSLFLCGFMPFLYSFTISFLVLFGRERENMYVQMTMPPLWAVRFSTETSIHRWTGHPAGREHSRDNSQKEGGPATVTTSAAAPECLKIRPRRRRRERGARVSTYRQDLRRKSLYWLLRFLPNSLPVLPHYQ